MTQLALIEALTGEIYDAIDRYGDAIPLAAALGILEVIKYELIRKAEREMG